MPISINRPPYAMTGNPGPAISSNIRTEEEIQRMRLAGNAAAEVLLEVQPFEIKGSDVQVETDEVSWKEVVTGNRSLPVSMATGLMTVTGDRVSLITFFNSFRE